MTPPHTENHDYATGEAIRLADTAKRIEDDFGYQDQWFPHGRRKIEQAANIERQGVWSTWTEVLPTTGDYRLVFEIEYAPEVQEYKFQLFWNWASVSQCLVRYENHGGHRNTHGPRIQGPHLNWGRRDGRAVAHSEIPADNLRLALRCFCGLPDVNIVLTGDLIWIPTHP